MCFGTEVAEKIELGAEQETPGTEMEEILDEGDTEPQSETPTTEEIKLAESMIELMLNGAALRLVNSAEYIGKEGVHSVANAILMLPLKGEVSPETKDAFNAFLKAEAKRLVAGALAEGQEFPEGLKQSAVAGN